MKKKIDKIKLFAKIIFSFETIVNFISLMVVPVIMYFKNPNIDFILLVVGIIFSVSLSWSVFLYFQALGVLNKIIITIEDESFTISDLIVNPSKIEFQKNETQFIMKIKSFSMRGTTLIVRPKIPEDNTDLVNKESYARYGKVEQIQPILQSMAS